VFKSSIENSFCKNLPQDLIEINTSRQVNNACYSWVKPEVFKNASLISFSKEVANEIGIDPNHDKFLGLISGNDLPTETTLFAMCYGGHQFGHWAGQLGDGRAINLLETVHQDKRYSLQLKGSGPTPYSRNADGYAVLRSSIREYLCSEAMHYLGVPTSRALSLCLTGKEVLRDEFYNGNSKMEKGAVVSRIAPSFIRFGSFQIFAARNDEKNLQLLLDYTIKYHFPELGSPSKETYIKFLKEVSDRTLEMIMHWQRVGFVHGVMNTDNMSIHGITIDYGPYGWLDDYDHDWTPNTTDAQNKRYRYWNQPEIALWNILQLANSLFSLIDESEPIVKILDDYKADYKMKYHEMMMSKLGLKDFVEMDRVLFKDLELLLQKSETDMTIFYRLLADFEKETPAEIFHDESGIKVIKDAFYYLSEVTGSLLMEWNDWLFSYGRRLQLEDVSNEDRKVNMNQVNPKYVLRNYMAQLAIEKAESEDYSLLHEFEEMLKNPYSEQEQFQHWFVKRPEWARNKPGSSALSCSS
jgi:uncharacterized protein YdiU (UPF0061 family)